MVERRSVVGAAAVLMALGAGCSSSDDVEEMAACAESSAEVCGLDEVELRDAVGRALEGDLDPDGVHGSCGASSGAELCLAHVGETTVIWLPNWNEEGVVRLGDDVEVPVSALWAGYRVSGRHNDYELAVGDLVLLSGSMADG